MTEQPEQKPGPFDMNKWIIRDALAAKARDPYKTDRLFSVEEPTLGGFQPKVDPFKAPEKANWLDEFFATPEASETAPAELPAETRQAVAQMYSQFQEFQRVGFSRDEAWELIRIGWATAVAMQARHQLGGS